MSKEPRYTCDSCGHKFETPTKPSVLTPSILSGCPECGCGLYTEASEHTQNDGDSMTVQELIDELQKVGNKSVPVCHLKTLFFRGSSWTGIYEAGSEPIAIVKVIVCKGDTLAGMNELDKIDHVDLISSED